MNSLLKAVIVVGSFSSVAHGMDWVALNFGVNHLNNSQKMLLIKEFKPLEMSSKGERCASFLQILRANNINLKTFCNGIYIPYKKQIAAKKDGENTAKSERAYKWADIVELGVKGDENTIKSTIDELRAKENKKTMTFRDRGSKTRSRSEKTRKSPTPAGQVNKLTVILALREMEKNPATFQDSGEQKGNSHARYLCTPGRGGVC